MQRERFTFKYGSDDSSFSIGIWFSTTVASGLNVIGLQDGCTDNSQRWDLKFLVGFDGKLHFGASCTMLVTPFRVTDGIWRHAVVTYSRFAMKLFIDGALITSSTPSNCADGSVWSGVWVLAGIRTTYWGNNFDGYGGYWPGKIGFLHIHNVTLSQTQVEASWRSIQDQVKQANSCTRGSSSIV